MSQSPPSQASRTTSPEAAPSAEQMLNGIANAISAAAAQSGKMLNGSMRTWLDESRAFVADMARDEAEALKELQACKSPLDVLEVEQKWIVARTRAYIDVGTRVMLSGFALAEEAAATTTPYRLPE